MTEREHLDARTYPELETVWRAVVDEHTCDACRAHDGAPHVVGEMPPHAECENPDGCRCTAEVVPVDRPRCSAGGCTEAPIVGVHWTGDAHDKPPVLRFCRTHATQQMLAAIEGSS